ncbi:MAG: amino acid transport protein [Gammaproteobacteria bacterium]|nr:amino acid transport protein [Gammaproteobacteria bacterium]
MLTISPMELFFTIFFSMVGIGYYSYGKKESLYFRISGVILLMYPYFVGNVWLLGGLGILFMILPFILDALFPLE